jgi:hypothetical protein
VSTETTLVEWKRWLGGNQWIAEIEGVSCQIDAPYDDTVAYRFHVYKNHPGGTIHAEATGDVPTWEAAKQIAERRARQIAAWCCGPTE